jgi:hypothetical protein
MDNVGIVVEDIELGLGLEGRALVEGEWAGLAIVKSRQDEDTHRMIDRRTVLIALPTLHPPLGAGAGGSGHRMTGVPICEC